MDVLILTAFVSLVLVCAGLWFFAWNHHNRAHDHADRLVLLPLAEDPQPEADDRALGGFS